MAGRPAIALAEQYGVKASCISKRASRGRWVDERAKFSSEIAELTSESFERAKRQFKYDVAESFGPWLEQAEEIRKAIRPGDVASFNMAVAALTKLHASGQKHFNLTDAPQVAIIVAGDLTSRFEEPEDEQAIDVESMLGVNGVFESNN